MLIGSVRIEVIQDDLTQQDTQVIVNPANTLLKMGGGVAGAIRRRGGLAIQKEADSLSPISLGQAVLTTAGELRSDYVIHTATMHMDFQTNHDILRLATLSVLICAEKNRIISLSFPALGCGVGHFPLEECARLMLREIFNYLREVRHSCLEEIRFVLLDRHSYLCFKEIISHSYIKELEEEYSLKPLATVDVIIKFATGVVLVERKNFPFGWALPGGFVNYSESLEYTVRREALEETGLYLDDLRQFHTYSEYGRDPRGHTITTVFTAIGKGRLASGSDAKKVSVFRLKELPANMAFDHKEILLEASRHYPLSTNKRGD